MTQMVLRGAGSGGGVMAPPQIDHVEPPEHLSPVAADLWAELIPELTTVGMLTTHDLLGFSQLCEAYADWCNARSALAENGGNYYKDARGNWKLHPAFYAVSDADRRLRGWCQEFALSPAVRLRFMAKQPVKDPRQGVIEDEAVDLSKLTPDEREALRSLAERRTIEAQESREDS